MLKWYSKSKESISKLGETNKFTLQLNNVFDLKKKVLFTWHVFKELFEWVVFFLLIFFHYFWYVDNKVYCILNQNPFLSDNFNINCEKVIPTKDIFIDAIHIKKKYFKTSCFIRISSIKMSFIRITFSLLYFEKKKIYISLLPHAWTFF